MVPHRRARHAQPRASWCCFEEPQPRRRVAGRRLPCRRATGSRRRRARLQELERELLVTKEYLQSTIEELESRQRGAASPPTRSCSPPTRSCRAPTRSWRPSKEELQSTNEELTTVNDELQNRMGELQLTNDDLHNVLAGIGDAIVIVGMDLRIRRFTQTRREVAEPGAE